MKPRREQLLYDLSIRLGIEVYVLEVGRSTFLPEQSGTGGFVGTKKGATLEWMKAAIEQPKEPLVWTHTHPNMAGFFSMTDEDGAHALFEMVRRPINAVVLGTTRYTETITDEWIEKHPLRPPLPPVKRWLGRYDHGHYGHGDYGYGGYSDEWDAYDNFYGRDQHHPGNYLHDHRLDRWGNWEWDPVAKVYRLAKPGSKGDKEWRLRKALNGLKNAYGEDLILETMHKLGMVELLKKATPERRRQMLLEYDRKEEKA